LIDFVDSGDKILDLGCGNGRLFDVLKDKDVEYIGIDNSPKLLAEARELHAEDQYRFIEADALNLPFKDNEFDKIISIAVLQHIPSYNYRVLFLKECLRTLKKGGKLILTV
jgi:ubiquinone/menaquinone biosynthesis C-methylase UbiE